MPLTFREKHLFYCKKSERVAMIVELLAGHSFIYLGHGMRASAVAGFLLQRFTLTSNYIARNDY